MNRKTSVALVIFVVLGIAAYLVVSKPPKGQRVGPRERPLAKLELKQIATVSIEEKGKPKVVLARKADKWRLTEPVDYAADSYATKTLGTKLEELEFGDMVTDRKSAHAQHKVDPASAVHVTVTGTGNKKLADLFVGEVSSGFTMLRLAGKDAVYQVVGSLRAVFSKPVKSWRDRAVLRFKREEARKLQVNTEAGEIVLARKDDKASWKVERSSTPVDQLDQSVVRSLLSTLSNLSAFDFVDDVSKTQTGLDKPNATVSVTLEGGTAKRVLVGSKTNDNYHLRSGDGGQVFLIKQYTADNLLKRPIDFRDKSILSFKEDDLVEIKLTHTSPKDKKRSVTTLTRKDTDWLKDGKKLSDAKKVKSAASALASLKADRFAKHSAADLGMAKPEWIVELRLKDRTRHRLTVGATEKDGFYGLQRQGVNDLFACRKYKLDKFLLKADDLK